MGFLEFVKKGIKIGMLNRDAASEVAASPDAFGPAVLTFAIAGLAGGIGTTVSTGGLGFMTVVVLPVIMVTFYAFMALVLHLLASMMGGKASYGEYYRALGAGAVVLWFMMFPIIGIFANFWYLPVAVVITERVHRIGMGRAVLVVLIPFAICIVLLLAALALGLLAVFGITAANVGV